MPSQVKALLKWHVGPYDPIGIGEAKINAMFGRGQRLRQRRFFDGTLAPANKICVNETATIGREQSCFFEPNGASFVYFA
ncbi:hypothetical protein LFADAHJC_LOCUS2339 [Methylorubrum extorquens]